MQHEVDRLTNLSAQEGFWDDPQEAEKMMRKRSKADNVVKNFTRIESDVRGLMELMDMAEGDEESLGELMEQIPELVAGVRALELKRMLTEDDDHNCILSINSGAGGSDAQDWAEMLLRMFSRWCNKKGFKTELLERNDGDVAGIASASMRVVGEYAYGFLRAEHGVHRLVRISKFSGRRETSFVGVNVVPELDDTIEIEIRPEDLEITTMRSGGAGGQHVNRTESAVRIKHLPTGYVVRCEQERSQHQNRDHAMKMVRGFLYEKERRDREAAFEDAFMSNMGSISFGSSMRSYTIHPSQMVKDERTKHKVTNADAVLDGDLDSFIETYLMMSADKREEDKKKKEEA